MDRDERSKDARKKFEGFSKEALAYFIVHEVMFLPSDAVEMVADIERQLTSDRLLKRMQEVTQELSSIPSFGSRKKRDHFFKLQDEFDLICKRLDRISKQRDRAWKKRVAQRATEGAK